MASGSSSNRPVRLPGWLRQLDRAISRGFLFRGSQIMAVCGGVFIVMMAAVTFVSVVGRRSPWAGAW